MVRHGGSGGTTAVYHSFWPLPNVHLHGGLIKVSPGRKIDQSILT